MNHCLTYWYMDMASCPRRCGLGGMGLLMRCLCHWWGGAGHREVLKQTLDTDELRQRDKWTLFGNEVEKVEVEVIRNQHTVRKRADRLALRQEVLCCLNILDYTALQCRIYRC